MSRRHILFECEGSVLAGTVDQAPGARGLLIVTGGNEVRGGAWNGQAQFAAKVAAAGYPVMRFDRRGVGDSEGTNLGFSDSAPDIAAALRAFQEACPHLAQVIALGNCDAASALMLAGGAGFDGLALANPWSFDDAAPVAVKTETVSEADVSELTPPPPAAPHMTPAMLRRHYWNRLKDPAAIWRLLTGKVELKQMAGSLQEAAAPPPPAPTLAGDMAAGIAHFVWPIRFLIAERDRTGQAFLDTWPKGDARVRKCAGASHSFVEAQAQQWLLDQVLDMLRL